MTQPRIAAAALLAVLPGLGAAQSVPCSLDPAEWNATLSEWLTGTWNVWNGPGVATMAGMVIPLPPQTVGTMTIATVDGELTAFGQGEEAVADFEVIWVTDETWGDRAPAMEDGATIANIVATAGSDCAPETLPHLRLVGAFPVQGHSLQVTMDLIVIDEATMWGWGDYFLAMGAANLEGLRATSLTR